MQSKTSQTLYAYWNDVRKGRLAPRRFEIEPSRITSVLSETFILERAERTRYRFRLAGTKVCELAGAELRGADFLDGWSADDQATLARQLVAAGDNGGILVVTYAAERDGNVALYEALLMPLLHTHDIADRFLGSLARLGNSSAAIGEDGSPRLVSAEIVWPDGKPHAALASTGQSGSGSRTAAFGTPRQSPFHPHVRNARIVRSEHRQFRVYEGGLTKPSGKI